MSRIRSRAPPADDDPATVQPDTGPRRWSAPAHARRTATGSTERAALVLDSDDAPQAAAQLIGLGEVLDAAARASPAATRTEPAATLAEAQQAGHHPESLLQQAISMRELDSADDMTDVLVWRLRRLADLTAHPGTAAGPTNAGIGRTAPPHRLFGGWGRPRQVVPARSAAARARSPARDTTARPPLSTSTPGEDRYASSPGQCLRP